MPGPIDAVHAKGAAVSVPRAQGTVRGAAGRSFAQVLAEHRASSAHQRGEALWAALQRLGHDVAQGERAIARAVRAARAGRLHAPEELLALQATVYRYSQQLQLASKLVDGWTQAVRRTVESQR